MAEPTRPDPTELTEAYDPGPADRDGPPVTGHDAVDQAVGRLLDLDDEPLSAHPERLARAHEALHAQLQPRSEGA